MTRILGISAFYHDSAAALIIDGKVAAAAQEERFTRIKHTAEFPKHAIEYCLKEGGISLEELDAVVFYDKPFLKFERLLENYYAFAPRGLNSFLKAMPEWINGKLFLKPRLKKMLHSIGDFDPKKCPILFTEHHLSHAASAFYPSPFDDAAVLTVDGVGEWATATIAHGQNAHLTILDEMHYPHSVGLLYSAFTYFLGFKVNSGEYKLMGLAPYGDPNSEQTKTVYQRIKSDMVDIKSDGSIWLNPSYFKYTTGLEMIQRRKWAKLFGISKRKPESPIDKHHCNLALAIQQVTEDIVIAMARTAKKRTGSKKLVMAGGVALNCVANGRLYEENIFEQIYVQPASGDAGGALGAALAGYHIYFEQDRAGFDQQQPFYGPQYQASDIGLLNETLDARSHEMASHEDLCDTVADYLAKGNVVGWFQGRMEFGPRALGNRSILADARSKDMRARLNAMVKLREDFRPFAPAVLQDLAATFFDGNTHSPYMLFTAQVKPEFATHDSHVLRSKPLKEMLHESAEGMTFPAVTHVDHSARLQTVSETNNPKFWQLLNAFHQKTGSPMLVNTSFNLRGEPMVMSPEDAYRCFMATDLDVLVLNNHIYLKTEQPDFENQEKWRQTFQED